MMAARKLTRRSAGCPSCSVALLNSLFGVQLKIQTAATPLTLRPQALGLSQREFHRSVARLNITERPEEITIATGSEVTKEHSASSTKVVIESTVELSEEGFSEEVILEPTLKLVEEKADALPWFLRVETPHLASHPLAERQALPEVPPDAPPALAPLLKYLSQELGINDLLFLDLRAIDPPPAIGANTIMIIGNARSERHLHISADKTCRWLRTEWKMTPHADGLLGRNEVKIKNRRLKKRGRLVNTETGAVEGVGWICVDVGSQGLVVQLFTKDRREEINLEKLWGKFLSKEAKVTKAVSIQDIFKEKELVEDVEVKYIPPAPVVRLGVGLSAGRGLSKVQTRSFHTTPLQHVSWKPKSRIRPYSVGDVKYRGLDIARSVECGRYWQLPRKPLKSDDPTKHITLSNLILRAQINHLKITYPGLNGSASRTGPCNFLGDGPMDTTSTEFLGILHKNLTTSKLTAEGFTYHLEFLVEAHRLQSSAYPVSYFLVYLNTMLAANIPLAPELYYLALRAISDSPQLRSSSLPWEESSAVSIKAMEEVTEHMKAHCTQPDISIPEIQYCFFRALVPHLFHQVYTVASTICSQSLALFNKPVDYVLQRHPPLRVGTYVLDPRLIDIERIVNAAGHTYTLREYQEALLTVYGMGGAWIGFWNRWKSMRYMCVHRDAELYGLAIGLLVMAKNQNECVNAARWLPCDMAREVPGVGLTVGMARGMLRLVQIAEGGGERKEEEEEEEEEEEGGGREGEFDELKKRCEGVVERVRRREEKLRSPEVEGVVCLEELCI